MLKKLLKNIGILEDFEIRNGCIIFLILSPGVIIYSILIATVNPYAVEIIGAREALGFMFLTIGLLPFIKNEKILKNYGWFLFGSLFIFSHYLIYTAYSNSFSLDYLLGTYVTVFGSVLLIKHRFLIVFFSASCLLHIFFRVHVSELNDMESGAILISMTTIFLFSIIILNSSLRYKASLLKNNLDLEEKVTSRTKDLKIRTNILGKKNSELEEYAHVISHDLKTPIRNIYTIAQWLKEDNHLVFTEKNNSDLDLIKEQATQMEMLVNGLLNYSLQNKQGSIRIDIDLETIVGNLAKSNTNGTCKVVLKNSLPKVRGIEVQLLQVFQNLIQNAIKYNDKTEKIIAINYKVTEDFHLFSVKDNGIGIEEKYFEKIFRLFQKLELNTEKDSIGIGLALVKKIINTMQGEVWLESRVGIGSIFYFTLPK
jgi:signal transduction histidine kinase